MKNPFRRRERVQREEQSAVTTPRTAKRLSPDGLQVTEFPSAFTQILRLYGVGSNYSSIYAHQPNVRTAIDTVAREAAELTLKLYMRDPRGDDLPSTRQEMRDERVIQLLNEPAPGMSTFRFWYSLFADIEVYDVAYWLKVRQAGVPAALMRIPPANLFPVRDPLTQQVLEFRTPFGTSYREEQLVVFWGYDPATGHGNIPPMESIRRVIAEDVAAGADREGRWRNAARKEGVIEPALEAKELSDEARESYLLDIEDALSGPTGSGRPLVLLPGHKYNDTNFSPREMEYIQARKLNRLEVAAHFHLPPAIMAAAGNNKEPDAETLRYFYKSSLSPRLSRVEHEIEAQLFPDFYPLPAVRRKFYLEFNMDEKLRADFETRAAIMSTTVGGPVATVNEGRARLNLPATDNPADDEIYVPTNSLRGGGPQASPQAPVETPAQGLEPAGVTPGGGTASDDIVGMVKALDDAEVQRKRNLAHEEFLRVERVRYEERMHGKLQSTFDRMKNAVRGGKGFDRKRWDKELADDLHGLALQTVDKFGADAAERIEGYWDLARTNNYIKVRSSGTARVLNDETETRLMEDNPDLDEVFSTERVDRAALTETTYWVNWAIIEAAHQNEEW